MKLSEQLQRFAEATEPSAAQVGRLRRRLGVEPDAALSREILSRLPEPAPGADARVRARLDRPAPTLRLPLAGLLLAAGLAAWFLREPPETPVLLSLEGEASAVAVGEHVRLVATGTGTAGGTDRRPRLRWDRGRLDVDVDHGEGIDLRVETAEAVVRVVGTAFTVRRDILGTGVDVVHGVVEVTCAGALPRRVKTGDTATCWPTRPAGLLGRARALQAAKAPPVDVLSTLDAVDARDADPIVTGEVLALRFDMLRALGRDDEALAAARDYRFGGYTERATEIAAAAVALELTRGDCRAASAWADVLDSDATVALGLRCADHAP